MKLSRNGRISLAIFIWLAVAVFLLYRGLIPHFANTEPTWIAILAIVLGAGMGFAKGKFVLRKSAKRTAGFIARRPEQDWFFFALHPILYFLIPLMMGLGFAVRKYAATDYPYLVVGLYVAISVALVVGSSGFKTAQAT
ncbi:MAG: hypothetical protein V3W41_03795 [Planctomycetota bacterium]